MKHKTKWAPGIAASLVIKDTITVALPTSELGYFTPLSWNLIQALCPHSKDAAPQWLQPHLFSDAYAGGATVHTSHVYTSKADFIAGDVIATQWRVPCEGH